MAVSVPPLQMLALFLSLTLPLRLSLSSSLPPRDEQRQQQGWESIDLQKLHPSSLSLHSLFLLTPPSVFHFLTHPFLLGCVCPPHLQYGFRRGWRRGLDGGPVGEMVGCISVFFFFPIFPFFFFFVAHCHCMTLTL